jgi:hypothetical protein
MLGVEDGPTDQQWYRVGHDRLVFIRHPPIMRVFPTSVDQSDSSSFASNVVETFFLILVLL